jgi:hypothetical protein
MAVVAGFWVVMYIDDNDHGYEVVTLVLVLAWATHQTCDENITIKG